MENKEQEFLYDWEETLNLNQYEEDLDNAEKKSIFSSFSKIFKKKNESRESYDFSEQLKEIQQEELQEELVSEAHDPVVESEGTMNLNEVASDSPEKKNLFPSFKNLFKKKEIPNKEDIQNPTQESEPIENVVSEESHTLITSDVWSDDIFQSLQDLDFNKVEEIQEKKEIKHPLYIAYKTSSTIVILLIFILSLFLIDTYLKTAKDNDIVGAFPICSYLSYSIEWYENSDCETLPMIVNNLSKKQSEIEKNIVTNLHTLLPRKLETDNVLNSSEVQFIQNKIWISRIKILSVLNKFEEIKNMSRYEWKDIECKGIVINEAWELKTSCDIYWGSIIPGTPSSSSRVTAIKFLENLQDKNNWFIIMNLPKKLDISKYSSTDWWIKWAFTTVTPLNLDLKFISNNKM
ncbi:MAG: hypothetical protein ACD_4C00259G0001 [uncultured bacterium (gcode 4)]|uniref:Uncharacterized protein n=1 Tax=uncultured bacterium (gcode 4) TaxID=1234023 RepID=K2GT19_9BACT|nr:MAG: hypothetical protein ACD_4C00259G0001 [uncultured bacterium (gcode 4)]